MTESGDDATPDQIGEEPEASNGDTPQLHDADVAELAPDEALVKAGPIDRNETDDPASQPVLQMRQVAGLTSGSVMELHVGSFQFHESESDVGFAIVVDEVEEALVVPGTASAHVDEVPRTEATPLEDAVLNVGSACFTVRPHRQPMTAETRLSGIEETKRAPGAITVPDLAIAAGGPTQNRSSRFGALFSRSDGEAEALDFRWWAFLETVREARSLVAERHRWLHPDPEELHSRLDRLDPGLWDRTRQHPLFGRIALAYATVPWEPRFDDPERIPTELHGLIREMSQLPWVPVTANLSHGPLGIVGSRAATLAATRHAVLSLASLTAPSDLSFSIVTAKGLIDSWSWTSALPNSLFADGRPSAFPVAIADGMVHFEGAGLAHEAVLKNEMGLIVLAETVEELPDYCATILHIGADGRCAVTNHLGEQVQGTPIGVTASFAARLAATLTEAIGDDDEALADIRPAAPPPVRPTRKSTEVEPFDQTDLDVDPNDDDHGVDHNGEDPDGDHQEDEELDDVAAAVSDALSSTAGDDEADGQLLADEFADELGQMFDPSRDT